MTSLPQRLRAGCWLTLLLGAEFTLAATASAQCAGDCDGDCKVEINELITGVTIALGNAQLSACPSFDTSGNGKVEINELIKAVNNALNGCDCPPICEFDSAKTGNMSDLALCSATFGGNCVSLSRQGERITGAIKLVECNAEPGPDGVRDCACEFVSFGEFQIPGIGPVCVTKPDAVCPTGVADCDGGSSVGIDLEVFAQIGACSSPAECDTMCDQHCAGLGKVRFSSGCELFCQGGDRDGLECECDTLGSATCPPTATLDCPSGSCVGKDAEADRDCQCQCINEAAGPAAPAGGLRCRLGTKIVVERNPPCTCTSDDPPSCVPDDPLVSLPPLCAPFTSTSATAVIHQANENTDEFDPLSTLGPYELNGQSVACADVNASRLSDLKLVANLVFFDSTIGDLVAQLTLDCK